MPDAYIAEPNDRVNRHAPTAYGFTVFADQTAASAGRLSNTLPELAQNIRAKQAPDKASLPWLKLATFGDQRSSKNSLRHNANVLSISGVEGDYDGGEITFAEAVGLARGAKVRALLYTTPSSTDDKPHWRILCPLSASSPPGARAGLVDRLNGIVGGGLAGESWVLSQAFFFGSIEGKPPVQVEIVDGPDYGYIDERSDLPSIPKPRRSKNAIAGGEWIQDGETYRRGETYFTIDGDCVDVHTSEKDWQYKLDTPGKIADATRYLGEHGAMDKDGPGDDYAAAAFLRDFGLSIDKAIELAVEHGADEDWAKTQVEHAWRYGQNPPGEKTTVGIFGGVEGDEVSAAAATEPGVDDTAAPRPRHIKSRAQSRDEPPPMYLIEGLLQEDCDAELVAPSGFLKSFVALDLGFSIATGRDALSQFTVNKPGPVFYFAGEGARNLKKKRATAWEMANGLEPYGAEDIYFADVVPLITNRQLVAELIEDARAWLDGRQPALFINDTLNRSLDGENENDAAVAARYLNMIKHIRRELGGGATLTIHHTGYAETGRGRGSSGFFAGYDTSLLIEEHVKSETTGVHEITIALKKQKDDDDGFCIYMRSKVIDTPEGTSLVLVPVAKADRPLPTADKRTKADQRQAI